MLKFFRLPFATTGDKTAVPDAVDSNGNVSYSQGYGFDYQRQKTDPAAKNIERNKMNQILFDITTAIAEIQSQGAPDYITSALNGGTAYSYGQYAIVKYSGALYISLVAANTALPSDATKWALLPTPALLQQAAYMSAAAGGTVDAITAAFTPAIAALPAAPGTLSVFVRAAGANTSATPTFKADALAAKTIVKGNNLPLVAGDIAGAAHWLELQYDATLDKWVLQNPANGIITPPNTQKNAVVDGACRMAQLAAKTLTTTAQYGAVDMFAAWGTGTAVSAGSIAQNTAAPIGQEGYSLHLSGVTITGSGVVYARHRIESAIAKRLKNKTASFSVLVYHDVGANVNYTAVIRKANAADNFSGVTAIATSAATAVPTVTGTLLTFTGVAMGDCSNGIEIEVQAACGAVTTKNFHFTEWQLEPGSNVTAFEIPPINDNIAAVERYLEKTYDLGVLPGTVTFTGAVHGDASAMSDITCVFRSRKRTTPTMAYWSALSGASGVICYQNTIGVAPQGDIPVVASRISTANVIVESSPGDQYVPIIHFTADARL